MKKNIFIAAAAALFAVNAFAQEVTVESHPSKEPAIRKVQTNGILDNLFFMAGAGVNGVVDNGSSNIGGLNIEAGIGKWWVPQLGVRIGYQGVSNKTVDTFGWFSGENAFGYHYAHVDVLWNLTNQILGYKASRIVNASIYGHGGCLVLTSDDTVIPEAAIGSGILASARITSWLDVIADIRATFAREEAFRGTGKVICFPSASVGLAVNFGKNTHTWKKSEKEIEVQTVTVLKDCDHNAQIKALEAERDSLLNLPTKVKEVVRTKYLNEGMVTYFVIDKWDLLPRERFHLEDFLQYVPKDATLTIVGHADKETGSHKRNDKLANERVKVVERALRDLGFTGTILTDAKGDTANPFTGNSPKNRCVTVKVKITK